MAKSETLWRCSICEKLHGSEKDALKCEEKHALTTLITTVYDNPTFEHVPLDPDQHDNIAREDIDGEAYQTDILKPSDFESINTITILTYSMIRRYDVYQRKGTKHDSGKELFDYEE